MKYAALLIPALFLSLFVYALFRRVRVYDCFTDGVKQAVPLVLSLFPYLAAMLILTELFEASGLSAMVLRALTPAFRALGVPPEIAPLVLVKPFSGSGATAVLTEILQTYGADSYIGRCACVAFGSSETVFYISAVYFAGIKKKLLLPTAVALAANFAGVLLGCALCRIF